MATELLEALQTVPADPTLLCWLGVAEREIGLSSSAYDRFREALSLGPEDPYVLATVGNGLAQFDDPDAEATLRAASVLAPELPMARWMYGAYLSREGLYPEALRELGEASKLAPEDPVVAYELGVAFALQGEFEKALDAVTRSVDLDPAEGWGLVIMGLLEAELGDLEEAARDLSEGAKLRPHDVEAQLLAALTAMSAGWADLAYEMLERGRQTAEPGDLPLLEAIEGRLDGEELDGDKEEAQILLTQELLPGALRERLMIRP